MGYGHGVDGLGLEALAGLELVEDDDPSDPYSQWVARVRSSGGVPTILPGDAIAVNTRSSSDVFRSFINSQGIPAAQYTAARAKQLGLVNYDATSRDGRYVYVVAPQDVIDFVAENGVVTSGVVASKPAIDRATEAGLPDWFKDLRTAEKLVLTIAVVGAGLYAFSFLPRSRA